MAECSEDLQLYSTLVVFR